MISANLEVIWEMSGKAGAGWRGAQMMILTGRSQHGVCGAFMALAGLVGCSPMASDGDRLGEPFAFETVPPAEAGEIDETAALTIALQSIRAKTDESQEGRLLRGVHPKSHGCVMARFVVNDDIEEKYQVGLFAQPGMKKGYDAWIRFSNASVLREHDLKGGGTAAAAWRSRSWMSQARC